MKTKALIFTAFMSLASLALGQEELFKPKFLLDSVGTAQDSVIVLQSGGSSGTKQAVEIPWATFVSLMSGGDSVTNQAETIAGGAVAFTSPSSITHLILTSEGGAGADQLTSLSVTGIAQGDLFFVSADTGSTVTLPHGATFDNGGRSVTVEPELDTAIYRYSSQSGVFVLVAEGRPKPLSGVVLTTESGEQTIEYPASDSDAARGAALAAALAAAVSGDHIIVPPGVFQMAAGWTMPTGVTLEGMGKGASTINWAGNAVTLDDDVTVKDISFLAGNIVGVTVNRVVFENVELDGTGMVATTDIVNISGLYSYNLRFLNCEVANSTASGYNLRNATDIQIIGGSVRGCAEHGIELYESGQHTPADPRSNSAVVSGTVLAGNTGDGINSWGDHDLRIVGIAAEYNDGSGVHIKNPIQTVVSSSVFEYNGSTAFTDAQLIFDLDDISAQSVNESNITVIGNTFSSDSTNVHLLKLLGTFDASYNFNISGNHFQDTSTASQTTGISCTDYKALYGMSITGNYFSGFNGAADKGINLGPSAGTINPEMVFISGNVFAELGVYALHIYGMTGVVIDSNIFDGNTNALFSNSGASTFRLTNNVFRNSSGSVVDLTGSTATYVALDNEGLTDTTPRGGGGADLSDANDGGATVSTITAGAFTRITTAHNIGSTDTLTTINGGSDGDWILIRASSGNTVTVDNGAGNINLGIAGDAVLDAVHKWLWLRYDSTAVEWQLVGASPSTLTVDTDLVNDTTPQLGGPLDTNLQSITSAAGADILIDPDTTGNVWIGNFEFDADQVVGVGTDNYVLTYDNATGHISLEAAAGGGGTGNVAMDSAVADDTNSDSIYISGINAGETLVKGDVVYRKTADGLWWKADNDVDVETGNAWGVAAADVTVGNPVNIMVRGIIRDSTKYTFSAGGVTVYVGATPGALTETAPSAAGSIVKVVGKSLSTSALYVDVTSHWVQLGALGQEETLVFVLSDMTTNLTTGDGKHYDRLPFAFEVSSVRASVHEAPATTNIIVDIETDVADNGTWASIFTTNLLNIDAGDRTSVGSATTPNITTTTLTDDMPIRFNVDQVGTGTTGKGLVVRLKGNRIP